MADVTYEPVKKALNRIKELSADEETRRMAFVRERALRDEVSLLKEAKREGLVEGRMEGEQVGIQKGRVEGEQIGSLRTKHETALNLINMNVLTVTDAQIAQASGLSEDNVKALRTEAKN